ncbi:hypothetical protein MRB53_041359 [Persea americana]|nr:hypothetical protein MRB53_041359 [Persea americana]
MEKITDKIAALPPGSLTFSLEFFPPKTAAGATNLLPRLTRLAQLRPLFVTVTWGAGGTTAEKSLELAELTQTRLGLTTCLHLTCTNMRRRVLDAALARAKELGVRNILALRGDEPREGEYATTDMEEVPEENEDGQGDDVSLVYAVDLVRYIRARYGSYFCIGVAVYPEGHASSCYTTQDPAVDMPHLIEKVRAGADFLMTQMFYDVEAFLKFKHSLDTHESGVFKGKPLIPGLMPIQSWGILRRTAKLSCASIPKDILARFEAVKADDEEVKQVGIDVMSGIVESIRDNAALRTSTRGTHDVAPQGQVFHFYTLNLEKAVAQILDRCDLVSNERSHENDARTLQPTKLVNGTKTALPSEQPDDTATSNRVIVQEPSSHDAQAQLETTQDAQALTADIAMSAAKQLNGRDAQASLGREATWDDYPNGRWGDARSPGKLPNQSLKHELIVT